MLRLVLADDEKTSRDCIVNFTDWASHGIEIVGIASDGIEAYDLVRSLVPDIVIMDIQMPAMSGLEVIEKCVSEEALNNVVFIIVSSYDNFEYAKQALHLGVEEYLLKPFFPDEFISAIYKAANRINYVSQFSTAASGKQTLSVRDQMMIPGSAFTSDISYPAQYEKQLLSALNACDDKATGYLHSFFRAVTAGNPDPDKQKSCYTILYVELYRFASLHNIALNGLRTFHRFEEEDHAGIVRYLQRELESTCSLIKAQLLESGSGSKIVRDAVAYIEEHYAEDLNLETVSRHVFVTPSYLSSLFRQNAGLSFIEYINSVRIEKSKELMKKEPHLKNYELAMRVGFSPKYYAQVFKLVEGKTVSEYRRTLG